MFPKDIFVVSQSQRWFWTVTDNKQKVTFCLVAHNGDSAEVAMARATSLKIFGVFPRGVGVYVRPASQEETDAWFQHVAVS